MKKHIGKCKSGTVGTDSDDDGKYVNFIFFNGTSLEPVSYTHLDVYKRQQ